MKKRLLCALLAAAMCFGETLSVSAVTVSANDVEVEQEEAISENTTEVDAEEADLSGSTSFQILSERKRF